jgi:hypothetical protein
MNIYYIYISIIIIGEIVRRIYFKHINIILFAWMMYGIITIYILGTAIIYRKEIEQKNINDINKNSNFLFSKNEIIDGFVVFGTNNDKRYLDSNSYVYIGEFINIILTVIMIFMIITNKPFNNIKYLLYGQITLAFIYYLTFTEYKFDTKENIIGTLAVSPWLIIPLIILFEHKQI